MGLGQTKHGEEGSIESFTQKGIGISETFRARSTKEQFLEKIRELALELSKRMAWEKLAGRVICLGLKKTDFFSISQQKKLPTYICEYEDILKHCEALLDANWPCDPVRKIRIRVSECKPVSQLKKDKNIKEFGTIYESEEARMIDVQRRLDQQNQEIIHSKRLTSIGRQSKIS